MTYLENVQPFCAYIRLKDDGVIKFSFVTFMSNIQLLSP